MKRLKVILAMLVASLAGVAKFAKLAGVTVVRIVGSFKKTSHGWAKKVKIGLCWLSRQGSGWLVKVFLRTTRGRKIFIKLDQRGR